MFPDEIVLDAGPVWEHYGAAMFGIFKKRRAIKSFVRDMGPALRQEFGKKPHYTAEEVRTSGRRVGSDMDYLPYAYVMFCTPDTFASQVSGSGDTRDYDSMRQEVGSTFFGGDTSFSADTVIEAGETSTGSDWSGGGDGGGGWDSGGGGDCGGGGGDSGGGGGGGGE